MSPAAGRREDEPRRGEQHARVRIPADVDRPDRILAGLTARQLALLAAGALVLWAGHAATRHLVPLPAYGAAALPLAALVALLAVGRVEGSPADRWVTAAARHHRAPRRLVPAPGGLPAPPALLGKAGGAGPAPLRLPIAGVAPDGLVDLGADGTALVCRGSAVTFSLRTPAEQEALVAGFAGFLNSLAEPVQLLVRSAPLDLTPAMDALTDAAPGLPHLAVERAARDHARFLATLAQTRTLLRREVLVVLRQPAGPAGQDAADRLRRRAAEAAAALAAAGVALQLLDGPGAAALLTACLDPAAPPGAVSAAVGADEPVTVAASVWTSTPPAGPMSAGQTGQEGDRR